MDITDIKYHVTFGDSASGCLRYYMTEIMKATETDVINIADDFSIGPLCNYSSKEGELNRVNWLTDLLIKTSTDSGTIEYYQDMISESKEALKKIGNTEKVLIWYGNNISDTIGLLYLSSVLVNHNNIYGVNVSDTAITSQTSVPYTPRSLGEVIPDNIDVLIPACKIIPTSLWSDYKERWNDISSVNSHLRTLEKDKICAQDISYYDPMIVRMCSFRYRKCASIVGRVLGETEQLISDLLIDWRIRILLDTKKLKSKGDVKTMRDFSIRKRVIS